MRIELDLPRDRVLLLDHESWHCVLNWNYLSLSSDEDDDWDRRVQGQGFDNQNLPSTLDVERRASWERVFDWDALRRSDIWRPVNYIYGVTEYLSFREVRGAHEFVAR
jgi:hypothetical protein